MKCGSDDRTLNLPACDPQYNSRFRLSLLMGAKTTGWKVGLILSPHGLLLTPYKRDKPVPTVGRVVSVPLNQVTRQPSQGRPALAPAGVL